MPAKPSPQLQFDTALLSLLACPACGGELRLDNTRLVCAGCGRGYLIVDGIPVLIAERAAPVGSGGSSIPPA